MKKIILIVILLLTSACYDYKEINDMAIISAIGVDKEDDEYIITFELLNDQVEKDSANITSYTKEGRGKTLTEAVENASDKLSKSPNYSHVKLMILSNSIVEDGLENIVDYFLRSTYYRENFYVITSIYNSPKELLDNTTEETPVASTAITSTLESADYGSNSSVVKTFDKIIEEIVTEGVDTSFSNVSVEDENFIIDGLAIFKDYDFLGVLDNDYSILYNIFNDDFYRPSYTIYYEDKPFTIAVTEGSISCSIEDGVIKVTGELTGKIMDNETSLDIKELNNIAFINEEFTKLLNDNITEFIKTLQDKKSDILGITQKYYQSTRNKTTTYWLSLDIESDITYAINKKGLIYDVTK